MATSKMHHVLNISKYLILFLLGIAVVKTFFAQNTEIENFCSYQNLTRLAIMVLFVFVSLFLFRGAPKPDGKNYSPSYSKVVNFLCIFLPILAIIFALVNFFWPEIGSIIVKGVGKENITRPAIYVKMLFDIISLSIFAFLAVKFAKLKSWLPMLVACLLVFVLFVMAMEEISWGQRIFQWQTSEYFLENSIQGETNLHNLNTQLFQNALYFGGFLMLVVLPFFRDHLTRLFRKFKITAWLPDLLPSAWMIGAFAAGIGFVDPANSSIGWRWGSIFFALIATAMILSTYACRLWRQKDPRKGAALLTLLSFSVVALTSLMSDKLSLIDSGSPTEYIELFIAFGIMCWAIDLRLRLKGKSYRIGKTD